MFLIILKPLQLNNYLQIIPMIQELVRNLYLLPLLGFVSASLSQSFRASLYHSKSFAFMSRSFCSFFIHWVLCRVNTNPITARNFSGRQRCLWAVVVRLQLGLNESITAVASGGNERDKMWETWVGGWRWIVGGEVGGITVYSVAQSINYWLAMSARIVRRTKHSTSVLFDRASSSPRIMSLSLYTSVSLSVFLRRSLSLCCSVSSSWFLLRLLSPASAYNISRCKP